MIQKSLKDEAGRKMASKDNKHFATEDWADFVNGQLSTEKSQAMQNHLNTGCPRCSKNAALWQSVSKAAQRESNYEPPASVVRHVRNAFSLMTEQKRPKRNFEIPRLVFDSLWQPALVGVRSAGSTPRQVLYRAGEIAIEMRLEPEVNSERVNVAGQVSNSDLEGEGIANVVVVISNGEQRIAETSTNRFGEFQLGFLPDEGHQISFGMAKGRDISIPLDGAGVRIFYR